MLNSTVHAGMRGTVLQTIKGAPPDLRALPPGCAFAPRCPMVAPACLTARPELLELTHGHAAACLRMDEPPI
jgi:peptide/nickel transport system ATP-binding protein